MICAAEEGKRIDGIMKDKGFSKKFVYLGAACTVVLFVIFGLFPGSCLGGAMGLNVAGILLGLPVTSGKLSSFLVAASMAIGVIVSGSIFITAAVTAGWLISRLLDAVKDRKRRANRTK